MNKVKIEKDEFDTWATESFIQYASCMVPYRPGMQQRLVFGACLAGGFKVTLGNETLYEGVSFSDAQSAFNNVV